MTAASTPSTPPTPPPIATFPLLPSDHPDPNRHDLNETYTIDAAMEAIGLGSFQYMVLLLAGLCWTAESMEMLLLSFIKSPLQCAWAINDSQAALITTSVAIGMLAGANVWGFVADRFGRRIAFIASTFFTAVLGLVSALSINYPMMVIARGFVGFGIGGVPVSFSILLEFLPVAQRGSWGMGLAMFWALGAIFEAGVAMVVLPHLGWRWLVAISTLPLFIVLFSSFGLSESPRWLLSRGRVEDAKYVLQRVASVNGRPLPNGTLSDVMPTSAATAPDYIPPEIIDPVNSVDLESSPPAPISSSTPSSSPADAEVDQIPQRPRRAGFTSIVRPGARLIAMYIALIWFVSAFIYYGVVMLQPEFISAENAGHRCTYARDECSALSSQPACSKAEICTWATGNSCLPTGAISTETTSGVRMLISTAELMRESTNSTGNVACARQLTQADFLSTLWASVGELPGVFFSFFLINKIGRRPLMGYFCAIGSGCFVALLWCIGRAGETIVFFLARGATSGLFQAIYLYTNEVYPAAVRARAMGMASSVARFGLISTPFIAQYLSNLSKVGAQIAYFVASLLAFIMILRLPIETTQRKLVNSMDELVDMLRGATNNTEDQETFAKDPTAPVVVRFFRWRARLDGEVWR